MNGGLSKTDRWLVFVVLALATAFILTVLAWLSLGRQMLDMMVRVQTLERLLRETKSASREEAMPISRGLEKINLNGSEFELEVVATAYAPGDPGVGGVTRSGIPVDHGVVAVDPDVIPIGSLVHVPGYGYAVAADTGGAIRGRRVDVYFADRSEAVRWGTRRLTVRIYRGDD